MHFSDSYVHRLIDEMLRVEGDYLRERYAADGVVSAPRTKHYYTSISSDAPASRRRPIFVASRNPGCTRSRTRAANVMLRSMT